eukprot:PITA_28312
MNEEYESIMKNDVWDVVPRPQDKYVVTSKWLYKIKQSVDGSAEKFKAIFVARGFSQKEGVDYDEIFAPVARYTTIHSIIALANAQRWNLHHMDVKTAFLHGSLKEEVYVEQPEGFEVQDRQTHVCRLKESPLWVEASTLGLVENDRTLILVLYVDDLFLTGADPFIHQCKRQLASKFDMKDLVLMHYFPGLEVWQKQGEIFLSQGKYIMKLLERFGMVDCKSVTTLMELNFNKSCRSAARPDLGNPSEYRQLIGALMFLVNSCPNICFIVHTLSQFMVERHHIHWIAAKNLLRYLRGTITYGLRYTIGNVRLYGYSDADWVGSVVEHKSTSKCCFSLGSASIFNIMDEQEAKVGYCKHH